MQDKEIWDKIKIKYPPILIGNTKGVHCCDMCNVQISEEMIDVKIKNNPVVLCLNCLYRMAMKLGCFQIGNSDEEAYDIWSCDS